MTPTSMGGNQSAAVWSTCLSICGRKPWAPWKGRQCCCPTQHCLQKILQQDGTLSLPGTTGKTGRYAGQPVLCPGIPWRQENDSKCLRGKGETGANPQRKSTWQCLGMMPLVLCDDPVADIPSTWFLYRKTPPSFIADWFPGQTGLWTSVAPDIFEPRASTSKKFYSPLAYMEASKWGGNLSRRGRIRLAKVPRAGKRKTLNHAEGEELVPKLVRRTE